MVKKRKSRKKRLLVGWDGIAAYLGCSVATAKRRENEGLPVARVGGTVCALSEEIDAWIAAKGGRGKARRE